MEISNKAWQYFIQDVSSPTIRMFKQFLITNHIYKEYFHNFLEYAKIYSSMSAGRGRAFIAHAFLWSNTPQGSSMWENLSFKWKRIFNGTHQ